MTVNKNIKIIEHALDNSVNEEDYGVFDVLNERENFNRTAPDPCSILPRQFGYWFNTGPGFADEESATYGLKIYSTKDARVLGTDGIVVYGNNWVDSMSLNYVKADAAYAQFKRVGAELLVNKTKRKLAGTYFLGFNAGHNNYSHWLTDQFPQICYYKNKLASDGMRLLLPKTHHSYLAQYIDLLEIDERLIEYVGDEVIEVEHLYYSSHFSFDAIPTSIPTILNAFKDKYLDKPECRIKGIFVSRNDTAIRSLLNEKAISEILMDHGFKVITPGKMTVKEQIAAFRSADCVIGIHGAGMANIAFCEPGTQVLELFPEYTVSPHFWELASHFRLNYGVLFGTSFDQDMALTQATGSWQSPFVIDEVALCQALDTFSNRLAHKFTAPGTVG